jgi:hypothetical protein
MLAMEGRPALTWPITIVAKKNKSEKFSKFNVKAAVFFEKSEIFPGLFLVKRTVFNHEAHVRRRSRFGGQEDHEEDWIGQFFLLLNS